jgi:hypothetical protein
MKRTMQGVFAAATLVTLAGCGGGDKLAENLAERQIESETGGDADIDFSDGNIKVETEDGSFQMSTDDDGNVVIKTEDAEGNEATISGDSEGNVTLDSDQGDASISNDDGEMRVETDEGTATISQGGDLPEGFPDLPFPDDMTIVMSQQADSTDGQTYVVIATAPGDWSEYLDQLTSYLDGEGYTQQSLTTTPDGGFALYLDPSGASGISIGVGADTSTDGMSINSALAPN